MHSHASADVSRSTRCVKYDEQALADEYTHVTFVKVDVDDNNETAAACNVKSMPTFQFFRKGSLIHTV